MKTKKILAILLALSMIFALAACGGGDDPADTAGDGGGDNGGELPTYIVATEPTFAPFETTTDDGEIIGFDMDLISAIGEDQGFQVEFKAFEFDSLMLATNNGDADIIAAAFNAMDPARQAQVDFSNTYYDSGLVVLVKENNETINSIDDLTAEMKVASQIATTGGDKADELAETGQIKESVILNSFSTAVLQLINGDVDAVIIDQPVAKDYLKKQSDKVKIVGDVLNAESYGFAVKKGNAELLDKINAGLQNMIDNGTYDELYDKWMNE